MLALFSIYDADGSGALDYREFSAIVFGKEVGSVSDRGSSSQGGRSGEDLLARLRNKLASRGARGIIGLGKQFRIMDDNNSHSLDKYEFTKAMQDYLLGFSEGEIAMLFQTFDYNRTGQVDYDEFLRTIRGPMNPSRKAVVTKAFNKLDTNRSGFIDIEDVRANYNALQHPDVMAGKKTEQDILQEFLETFETAHNIRYENTPDYIVSRHEFDEYYNNISASIDDDAYFALMMNNAWNLDGSMIHQKNWGNNNGGKAAPKQAPVEANPNANTDCRREACVAEPTGMDVEGLISMFRAALIRRGTRGI